MGVRIEKVSSRMILGKTVSTALPQNAIVIDGDGHFVMAATSRDIDKFEQWEVKLGNTWDTQYIETTSGIYAGDYVLVKNGVTRKTPLKPTPTSAPPRPVAKPVAVAKKQPVIVAQPVKQSPPSQGLPSPYANPTKQPQPIAMAKPVVTPSQQTQTYSYPQQQPTQAQQNRVYQYQPEPVLPSINEQYDNFLPPPHQVDLQPFELPVQNSQYTVYPNPVEIFPAPMPMPVEPGFGYPQIQPIHLPAPVCGQQVYHPQPVLRHHHHRGGHGGKGKGRGRNHCR